jgi:hypothetical protein
MGTTLEPALGRIRPMGRAAEPGAQNESVKMVTALTNRKPDHAMSRHSVLVERVRLRYTTIAPIRNATTPSRLQFGRPFDSKGCSPRIQPQQDDTVAP